ncbi:MAG: hypothetical protein OER90_16295 [Gemmatimonadota bacterium]|nr:hypothetical protein [Gemmatimonadota bacterium]
MAEAASVCLDDCGHTSPTYLAVDGDQDRSYAMIWQLVTEQARRSWADEQFATEQGAYGVAILLVRDMRGHSVVERSRKGNGFDYWMGPADGTLFSAKSRLEVSGIRRGDPGQIGRRVREKTQQIAVSSGRLPGIVVVVEFGKPIARLVDR